MAILLSRATCEQPKTQEKATYLAPVQQSIKHTTSSNMPSSSSQSSWSLHRNSRKHFPRRLPRSYPSRLAADCQDNTFSSWQAPKPRNRSPTPKATSAWKLWNRSSEFIRFFKAPFLAAVQNRMKSKHFCFFCSPVKLISSPHSILPTAPLTQMEAF